MPVEAMLLQLYVLESGYPPGARDVALAGVSKFMCAAGVAGSAPCAAC